MLCPVNLEIFIGRFAWNSIKRDFSGFSGEFHTVFRIDNLRIILRFFASFEKFLAENRESIEMKQIPSILCPSHRCENE